MTEFRIGMKTSEVLRQVQAQKTNATDSTKQLIFNFCNNDQDGKISNSTELAMLNAWISGSEKIPMPEMPKHNISEKEPVEIDNFKGYEQNFWGPLEENQSEEKYIDSKYDTFPAHAREFFEHGTIMYDKDGNFSYQSVGSNELTAENGKIKEIVDDSLTDIDGDGYADYRSTNYSKSIFSVGKTVIDSNLDGIPDTDITPQRYDKGNHN